jgi:hypothetical protein
MKTLQAVALEKPFGAEVLPVEFVLKRSRDGAKAITIILRLFRSSE